MSPSMPLQLPSDEQRARWKNKILAQRGKERSVSPCKRRKEVILYLGRVSTISGLSERGMRLIGKFVTQDTCTLIKFYTIKLIHTQKQQYNNSFAYICISFCLSDPKKLCVYHVPTPITSWIPIRVLHFKRPWAKQMESMVVKLVMLMACHCFFFLLSNLQPFQLHHV